MKVKIPKGLQKAVKKMAKSKAVKKIAKGAKEVCKSCCEGS